MPVTPEAIFDSPPNVVRRLLSGSWEFVDQAGDRIALFNGKTRTFELPSGALLSLGGVELAATFTELNQLASATGIAAAEGLGQLGLAHGIFDPTADEAMRTVAPHGLGVTIPIGAIVCGGFQRVETLFASADSTAQIATSIQGANDIQTAAAVSGAPWSTTGLKAIVPKANTPESTGILLTAAREITQTVTVQALTGGKAHTFLYYARS